MRSTLATMAILKANWDERRDYLSNFQPFVSDVLRRWPDAEPIVPAGVADEVKRHWGIDIPAMTVQTMLNRARQAGLVTRANPEPTLFVVSDAVTERTVDLASARDAALRNMNALIDRLVEFAHDQGFTWTPDDAEAALMGYLDEFGTIFAARRRGTAWAQKTTTSKVTTLVHAFARYADERDPQILDWLEEAVKGSMFANVLHFENPTDAEGRLDKLIVYLDTSIIVRVLGVSEPTLVAAAREMMQLFGAVGASPRVFDHTVVEIEGVLRAVTQNLRTPRRQATHETARMSWQRREVLDHFLAEGRRPADVEEIIATLDRRLRQAGIQQELTPPHLEHLTLDEDKLSDVLRERINYRVPGSDRGAAPRQGRRAARIPALDRDVDSLTAVHRLRKGKVYRGLRECPAVFLTDNRQLAVTSRAYFREEGMQAGVPHCFWEPELVTQLWIRTPSAVPDLPRKTILADSYAALNPPASLWEKYVTRIEEMERNKTLTEDDVTSLIYSTTARSVLFDLTGGDEDRLQDETITEVLERSAADAVAPERQRADVAELRLREEQERAADVLAEKEQALSERDARIDQLAKDVATLRADRARDRERARRRWTWMPAALISAALAVVPLLAGWSELTTIIGVSIGAAGALIFGLAAFLPWKRTFEVAVIIIGIAGIIGIASVVVQGVREDDDASTTTRTVP